MDETNSNNKDNKVTSTNEANLDNNAEQANDCCSGKNGKSKKPSKGIVNGIAYGLMPHIGCIAFIAFSILGVTAATAFVRPLLMNAYSFYILIALSFALATISAGIYLRKNNMFSIAGAKRKKGYLATLYGTTIMVNLLFFMVIFPYAANIVSASQNDLSRAYSASSQSTLTLKVEIPCSGHATLITGEINKIIGVTSVKFRLPNLFDIAYDARTSKQQIMALDIFKTYAATDYYTDKNN